MADIPTKTFAGLVQTQVAAVQSWASGLVDFTIGSVLRALVEAVAGVARWLQALILAVLAITRASTATGSDLDSWVADFGAAYPDVPAATFARLAAVGSVGPVTFARYTTVAAASVPVGTTISTADGKQQFVVVADLTKPGYQAGTNSYVMAIGTASVQATVQAITPGAASNVTAGLINTLTSAVVGGYTVTNAADFTSGADAESDADLRIRFRAFILSLREATPSALAYWVSSLGPAITVTLVENQEVGGAARKGIVLVVVDDGTGTPSSAVLAAASTAVNAHRAGGIEYAVLAPTVVSVAVAVDITTSAEDTATKAAVTLAIQSYLNTLPVGSAVYYTMVYAVIYAASDLVVAATGLTLNGTSGNLAITSTQVAKAGSVSVT
jgi:uncharacterized phage protein gp47/JayE